MPEERGPWWARRRDEEGAGLPAARGTGSRRAFGSTWWGKAWIEALEHRARLDPGRLARGRSYARRGSVLDLTVDPGVVHATVQGSRRHPYAVTVRIRAFSSTEWESVLEVVSAQIGRVAALLDGELPPEVVDDARAAGLELLPDAGEVRTECNCPDFAVPCKHSAAVCYLIADALDEDPFALLLLRGRRRDEVLSALRARRQVAETPVLKAQPVGVLAKAAFAKEPGSVPLPPRPPGQPGVPVAVSVLEPPRHSGVEVGDLVALATDAARRAWELASGDGDGGLGLTRDQDLARRAAGLIGTPGLAELAHRGGVPARVLTSWAVAWREAGAAGLAVAVEDPFEVDDTALAEAQDALRAATAQEVAAGARPSERRDTAERHVVEHHTADRNTAEQHTAERHIGERHVVEGNRVSLGRIQLRLGRDGLWYLFKEQFGDWMLAGPPSPDPAELLAPTERSGQSSQPRDLRP